MPGRQLLSIIMANHTLPLRCPSSGESPRSVMTRIGFEPRWLSVCSDIIVESTCLNCGVLRYFARLPPPLKPSATPHLTSTHITASTAQLSALHHAKRIPTHVHLTTEHLPNRRVLLTRPLPRNLCLNRLGTLQFDRELRVSCHSTAPARNLH